MVTNEEIERRVKQADIHRQSRRSAAAQRVNDLAGRRGTLTEQLAEIDRELRTIVAEIADVMDIDELAEFTDIPPRELAQWVTERTPRTRSAAGRRAQPRSRRAPAHPGTTENSPPPTAASDIDAETPASSGGIQ